MSDEKFLISTPLDDECDTVTYAQGKHKKYYDPDSKRYRIMDNKGYAKLWIANDLYEIAEGDNNIVAYITYLLSNMNYDSAITRYDKHLKARILIKNREELAEILHLNYSSGRTRGKIKKLIDMDIIFEAKVKINNYPVYYTYYLNPLIGMRNKGISLDCYMHFRHILINNLPKRAIKNLDKHVIEEYGKDAINILPSEDVPKMDKIE